MAHHRDYDEWRNLTDDGGHRSLEGRGRLESEKTVRSAQIKRIERDLVRIFTTRGDSKNQIENKVDRLFNTYAAEWCIFVLVGTDAAADAVIADTGIAWLDTTVQPEGNTIRQRILNRIT